MPVETIVNPEVTGASGYPKRKRWTRAECRALESTGLWNTQKLELIEGDLIDRMGRNLPHVDTMMLVLEWLVGVFGIRYIAPEATVDVAPEDNPTSEPEPDLAVLVQPRSAYRGENPKPADIRLLVEISDTTLAFDRKVKAGLYARAGIAEYWVVDVVGRRVLVHRDPGSEGWGEVTSHGLGDSIEPLSAPGRKFLVDDAFPGSV